VQIEELNDLKCESVCVKIYESSRDWLILEVRYRTPSPTEQGGCIGGRAGGGGAEGAVASHLQTRGQTVSNAPILQTWWNDACKHGKNIGIHR